MAWRPESKLYISFLYLTLFIKLYSCSQLLKNIVDVKKWFLCQIIIIEDTKLQNKCTRSEQNTNDTRGLTAPVIVSTETLSLIYCWMQQVDRWKNLDPTSGVYSSTQLQWLVGQLSQLMNDRWVVFFQRECGATVVFIRFTVTSALVWHCSCQPRLSLRFYLDSRLFPGKTILAEQHCLTAQSQTEDFGENSDLLFVKFRSRATTDFLT